MEEFRRLALEGVTDELESPSDEEQSQRIHPQPVEEDAGYKKWDREQDGRNAQRVTQAVHRVQMTGSVLRDPLLVSASAQHAQDDITIRAGKKRPASATNCQRYNCSAHSAMGNFRRIDSRVDSIQNIAEKSGPVAFGPDTDDRPASA